MEAYEGDKYQGWAEYVTYGGLPMAVKARKNNKGYALRTGELPPDIAIKLDRMLDRVYIEGESYGSIKE
jgi:hypothetical protein